MPKPWGAEEKEEVRVPHRYFNNQNGSNELVTYELDSITGHFKLNDLYK